MIITKEDYDALESKLGHPPTDEEILAASDEDDNQIDEAKSWEESQHPRADDGKFGSGGSATSSTQTPEPQLSLKAARAKAAHHMVDKTIQRYAEDHNEPKFAKAMGGVSFPDSEPVDVVIAGNSGVLQHGIELKTMVSNKANKITMKKAARDRKEAWERNNKATYHTVVFDDQQVFNAKGEGKHDESKRVMYYRRGFGSFRVGGMHKVNDLSELKTLMNTSNEKLPKAAQRTDGVK